MSKTKLIIWREYWTRVRKPSFIVMSILGPLLVALTFIIPVLIKQNTFKTTYVQIVDHSHFIAPVLKKHYQSDNVVYLTDFADNDINKVLDKFEKSNDTAVAYIPSNFISVANGIKIFHKNHPGINTIAKLRRDLQDIRVKHILHHETKINLNDLENTIQNVEVTYAEEGGSMELKIFIGLGAGIMMYFFITLYGVQVMRGVMEEKTNRIVEIIISSVKPVQLLYGKIIGIVMAGLTQFIILLVSLLLLVSVAKTYFISSTIEKAQMQISALGSAENKVTTNSIQPQEQNLSMSEENISIYLEEIKSVVPKVLVFFIFFFIGGYLLYASLFAAAGAAVDSETETQQFVLPITIPIVVGIIIATNIYEVPNGNLAFWASMIPFTSPIVMIARLPFMDLSSQWWEVLLSLALLYLTFILTTKLAAKIYRTGILMYGQKASYKSILKWLRYKN